MLPEPSVIESLSTSAIPIVPLPLPVLTVTTYELPLPVTLTIVGAVTLPPGVSWKSAALTPETDLLKLTV